MRFSSQTLLWKTALGLALFFATFLLPTEMVFAQADNRAASVLGLTQNIGNQTGNIPKLIAIICYVIGIFFTAKGVLLMRALGGKQGGDALMPMVGFLTVGTLLILLPYTVGVMANSLGVQSMSANTAESAADTYHVGENSDNPAGGIQKIFFNLTMKTQGFPQAMIIFCYVMAVIMTLGGLYDLKSYGDDPSRASVKAIVSKFGLAASLLSIPFAMQIIITTMTGADSIRDSGDAEYQLKSRPCLMRGSSLMGLRGGTARGSGC